MQQVKLTSVDNLPPTGYYVSNEQKKEKFYKNESHIHKQGPLAGIKVSAHRLTNDIFTYFPKGFSGSKNSDFYEYLSLGMVPYLVGSAMLIATNLPNKLYNASDAMEAGKCAKRFGAGVVLYGLGKLASQKLSRTLIHKTTGIPLDLYFLNRVNELPEPGREKGLVRVQYPKIFDSVNFYRRDILAKDGEINHGNLYYFNDQLAKKLGYDKKLNDPEQTTGDKIRATKARATALESISKYVTAACGVALGNQAAFEDLKIAHPTTYISCFKKACKQLWQPKKGKNILTKYYGRTLAIASLATTLLAWIIPSLTFKRKPDTIKTKIDDKKEFEVA